MNNTSEGRVKVAFELQKDSDSYPPVDVERLWVKKVGDDIYELDNVPFFVKGVNCCDIIEAYSKNDELFFHVVLTPSGHSTLRVVFFDRAQVEELRAILRQHGCATELSHLPNLISIDVPPSILIDPIISLLKEGEEKGLWEYEEASIRHP